MIFKKHALERVDSFIIILCILCATASSSWLFYDIVLHQNNFNGNAPIGKITSVKNHVKRKFNKSMIWYDASQKETVFENDWIFTGSESTTTIVLNEGGEISVDPDSLIILSRTNGILNLNLQHGSMIANVSKNIGINVFRNGQLQKVDLTKKNQRVAQRLKPLVKKVIPKTGEIFLKSPTDFETLWVSESKESELSWESSDNIKDFKVEMSRNSDFSEPITEKYNKNKAKIKLPMTGKVFWRVSDSSNPKIQSETFSFNVKVNTPPVSAMDLAENESLQLTSKNGITSPAPLKWTDTFNSWNNYELQISKSSTFTEILAEGSTPDTLFNFKPKSSGLYYWRIRGSDEGQSVISSWSKAHPLKININETAKKEIQLARKTIRFDLTNKETAAVQADTTVNLLEINKPLNLRWRTNYPAPSYRIQISSKPDFSKNFEDVVSKRKTISFNSIPLGTSYYRVIVEKKSGKPDFTSPTGKVIAYLPKPSKLKNKMEEYSNTMTWAPLQGAETFEVSYIDKKDSPAKKEYVSSNELKVRNDDKYLKWKIRAVDTQTKQPFSEFTKLDIWRKPEVKKLASVKPPKGAGLLYPIITNPPKRKTFVAIGDNEIFFVMKWKYSRKVDFYDVEISKTKDMDDVVFKKKVRRKKRSAVKQSFRPGMYYMRVRAIKKGSPSAWSDVKVFRVQNQD